LDLSGRLYTSRVAGATDLEFDSGGVGVGVMRGVVALLLVVVAPGVIYLLSVRRDVRGAAALVFAGGIALYFGRAFLRHFEVARGTITAATVVARPVHVFGLRLAGPEGSFSRDAFEIVRLERLSAEASEQPQARVRLIGRPGTPAILLARASAAEAERFAGDTATLLGLPLEDVRAAY
jgi:hypothetical protein